MKRKEILQNIIISFPVDDDAKSVPESLEAIRSRLAALESNQTNVVDKLAEIHVVVDRLSVSARDMVMVTPFIQARLDQVNASIVVERGEDPANLNQDVAELREGVGEVTKQLAVAVNSSTSNSDSITRLSRELNTLKVGRSFETCLIFTILQLNEIDMKNGRSTSLQTSGNLSILETRMNVLNSTLAVQDHRVDTINSTMLDMGHNLTSRMELDHSDVVALMVSPCHHLTPPQGKVSQLQDDNLNVSSSLATLSSHCSTELHSLLANITSLQERVVGVEGKQVEAEVGGRQGEVLAQSPGQGSEPQVTPRPPGLADRGIRGKKVGEPRYLGV